METKDILRRCIFTPYHKGAGPKFRLTMWDTGRRGEYGKAVIGYSLEERAVPWVCGPKWVPLFEGEDFTAPAVRAIDSDEVVACLMGFLTLRPGDTDADYFKDYTDVQRAYCAAHAEALSLEVLNRFGEV